jgi:hypothetical protein
MKLIKETTGQELKIGDTVKTFDGEEAVLKGFREPHKPSSTGRVYVRLSERSFDEEFFPSVIGAKFV